MKIRIPTQTLTPKIFNKIVDSYCHVSKYRFAFYYIYSTSHNEDFITFVLLERYDYKRGTYEKVYNLGEKNRAKLNTWIEELLLSII
jgi:hypothetical protein